MKESRKLRLGFVSVGDASDVHSWSGIPFQILAELRTLDIQVELLSPLSRKLKYALMPQILWARIRKQGFILDHSSLLLASYARQIEAMLSEREVDVIFSTSSIPITYLRCKQPIVFWTDSVFHSMANYYGSVFRNLSKDSLRKGREQEEMALRRSAAALYASEWAAAGARLLTAPEKVSVLPFGSSLRNDDTAETVALHAKEKRGLDPKRCNLLFVGVDWDRKGGDIAVQAASILKSGGWKVALRIVGASPHGEVPSFVESLGFISKSTQEGRDRLAELYRDADVFVLPTKAEAAGVVFCEAGAFGLPSITYDTGGIGEYVRDGVNGVKVPEGSPAAAFAREVELLLRNADRYVELSVASYHEFTSRLNWRTSVIQLVHLCRKLALPDSPD